MSFLSRNTRGKDTAQTHGNWRVQEHSLMRKDFQFFRLVMMMINTWMVVTLQNK